MAKRLGATLLGLILLVGTVACSPEAPRVQGGGPGADIGNRGAEAKAPSAPPPQRPSFSPVPSPVFSPVPTPSPSPGPSPAAR